MHTQETERSKTSFLTGTLVPGPQLSDMDNQRETESSRTEDTQKTARWASMNEEREKIHNSSGHTN